MSISDFRVAEYLRLYPGADLMEIVNRLQIDAMTVSVALDRILDGAAAHTSSRRRAR